MRRDARVVVGGGDRDDGRGSASRSKCTRIGPRPAHREHVSDWLLNGGRSASSTEVVMGRLCRTRTPLRSPMPCYWEQRPVALQRRTAIGQWYDARSAAWIEYPESARHAGGSPGRVPGGEDLLPRRDHRAQSPAAPDLISRPRSSVARAWLAPNLARLGSVSGPPRTLGMVAAKLATRPRGSEVRGGGLEPDGEARPAWIFQGFTSAGIRR
jgi:hypothetical protein